MKNLLTVIAVFGAFSGFANTPVDSAEYYYSKGLEEKAAQRYLTASQYFVKATSINNSFADAFIENGNVNLEMHKTDEAKDNFTRAYELQPSNSASIKALADLYFNYRQWDKAIEFAQKCTNCSNSDRIIGLANFEKEDYGQAEKYLLKATAKNPQDAQALYTLGRSYVEMEEETKATPYYEKALAISPDKNAWAYELGLLYFNNNDFKNSVKAFELAEAHGYIRSNDFLENYGYALLYSGNFDAGEQKLMALYQKKPGDKTIISDLATVLYQQRQYARSLDYCQKLMEMNPKDGKALYQAGLDFQKMGQKEKGQAMCEQAIKLDPSLESLRSKKMDMGDNIGAL